MNIPSISQIEKVEHDTLDLIWRLKGHSSSRKCANEIGHLEKSLTNLRSLKASLLKASPSVLRKTGTTNVAEPTLARRIELGTPNESLQKRASDERDALGLVKFSLRTQGKRISTGRDLAAWRDR
jgi:hypothetical protein